MITLAIPSKGRLKEQSLDVLAKAGLGQHVERLLLETAFRGDRQRDHLALSRKASMRSSQTEKPTPGIGFFAPSSVNSRS